MKNSRKILGILGLFLITTLNAQNLSLPKIFDNNMMLQRDQPCAIWGKSLPNALVDIKIGHSTTSCRANEKGNWKTYLSPLSSGLNYHMKIVSVNQSVEFRNIAVGDVYYAGGQSNMQFGLLRSENGKEDVAKAGNKNIRIFTVSHQISYRPLDDIIASSDSKPLENNWQECNPETVKEFSAVAYYFARKIQSEVGVPVGIINVSWGGTPIEAHMSYEANRQLPYHRAGAIELENNSSAKTKADFTKQPPQEPSSVFNSMISPIIPYSISGFLWYQGEQNWNYPYRYREQLVTFINDMRIRWGQGYLPFYLVQIHNMGKIPVQPMEDFWSVLRESQTLALNLSQTGMVVTVDVGDGDLHPKDKKSVGERLALLAEKNIYQKNISCEGPVFESFKTKNDTIELTFKPNGSGLTFRTDSLKGFAIANESKQFKWAKSKISGNKVLLFATGVDHPVAARYGWGENPVCTLCNIEGLPASPFRTDHWVVRSDGTW